MQAKATQALTRLKQGEDFGVLVKAYSDGAEREKGGLMGVRPLNRYPTLFADVAQNLKVGEVSAVIRSGAGFHILKLVSKKNKEQVTVTEARARHICCAPEANSAKVQRVDSWLSTNVKLSQAKKTLQI